MIAHTQVTYTLNSTYISLNPQQAQRFNITFGTTESALSEDAQKLVHSITKSDEPMGWEYQIDDEYAGSVGYLSHFNLMRNQALANTDYEISNVSEINVGNLEVISRLALCFVGVQI